MRQVRGRGAEGLLVVCRGFVRSRYEGQFAAAAYALVAPVHRSRLSVEGASAGQRGSESPEVTALHRRPA
jgi:hypothetical protein